LEIASLSDLLKHMDVIGKMLEYEIKKWESSGTK
jgi:hypothetical protein